MAEKTALKGITTPFSQMNLNSLFYYKGNFTKHTFFSRLNLHKDEQFPHISPEIPPVWVVYTASRA